VFNPCVVIPIYNHKESIGDVVRQLEPLAIPILIVDDGSDTDTRAVLTSLDGRHKHVSVKHLPKNGGKGHALRAGLSWAAMQGFSHALQVDADGQHTLTDAPTFLTAAQAQPEALVLGKPRFDADAPAARIHGRKLSVALVHLQTLSRAIADPLFGFRVYPLAETTALLTQQHLGNRMDFDPEIAVRLFRRGVPIVNIASAVCYPEGGLSHFRMIRDNLILSWMHMRLVLGIIPWLLTRWWHR
jgi:glycosyltransferase involved in cell wall biosynthesis